MQDAKKCVTLFAGDLCSFKLRPLTKNLLFQSHYPNNSSSKMNRAIFLDRDGTIIEEREYLHRVEQLFIFPGAIEALKSLQDAGFRLFIVSNQSGVGRGYFTLADVEAVNQHLAQQFARGGVRFEKIYIAPEAP